MQFDWTTFVLEVINFIVLLWLLKHFFYKPVLNILDARQERVRKELARAEKLQKDADALKHEYQARLADWEKEREQARQNLEEELTQLKIVSTDNIKQSLLDEKAKWQVKNQAITASHDAEVARQAASEAYANVAAMLSRLATPELTANILKIFLEDLVQMPESELTALRKAAQAFEGDAQVEVTSAHSLDNKVLSKISNALTEVTQHKLHITFKLNSELIAGLRVTIGECLLHANLAEELQFFRKHSKNA
ncbi:MAG TPA: F0F1 ATP synthase subunit delta [Methylophilaceae bacterium]|nr:F0F1 ATP synthase subunit delta [Methylophilaceae bacterium]